MKLLTEHLLREYGFIDNPAKSSTKVKVMSYNDFDVFLKVDGIYHTNTSTNYPLRDTASLRKKYKEVSGKDLKPIDHNIIS